MVSKERKVFFFFWNESRRTGKAHGRIRLSRPNESLPSQGYAVAWSEEGDILSMVLLKYFAKEHKQDWIREVDVAKRLCSEREEFPVLLNYRWHSKGE